MENIMKMRDIYENIHTVRDMIDNSAEKFGNKVFIKYFDGDEII